MTILLLFDIICHIIIMDKKSQSLYSYLHKEITGRQFNDLTSGQIWCKLLKKSGIHNGLEFKPNTMICDKLEFDPTGERKSGGIYCCNINDIHIWFSYADGIMYHYSTVSIPDDARVYVEFGAIKVNKLHLGDFKKIWSDEKIVLSIVKYDGDALKYSEIQNEVICLVAVQQYGRALKNIIIQNDNICLAAVKNCGMALEFVKDKKEHICIAAVQQEAFAIRHVDVKTRDICLASVMKNGMTLCHIEDQTVELCIIAMYQNQFAHLYVKQHLRNAVCNALKSLT
jgi:hypothetical protein